MTQSVTFQELSVQQAQTWISAGAYVVDVREDYEYAMGHLPEAVNLPLSRFIHELHTLPKDRSLLVVCASGGRSSQVAQYLLTQGFAAEQVGNLEGGTFGWIEAGLGVQR